MGYISGVVVSHKYNVSTESHTVSNRGYFEILKNDVACET